MIIKSSRWANAGESSHHPEYAAIHNLVESTRQTRFVLVGTTSKHSQALIQSQNVITHDLRTGSSFNFMGYVLSLTLLLFRYRPRVTIVFGPQLFPVGLYCILSRHAKFVPIVIGEFNYYGYNKLGQTLTGFIWRLNWLSLRFSKSKLAAAYTLSTYTRGGVVKNVPELQVQLVSYTISSMFKESTEKPVSHNPVLLVNAGIEPRKGLHVLIRAIPLLHKQVDVVIKGEIRDLRYMQELESLIHRLRLENAITFDTSFYGDERLASIYGKAAIFVFPTLEDCLGVVVLEALHCGLPVIASNNSGVTDMVVDRQNGLLVPPENPVELARAMNELLENEPLRQKLAANALKVLQKHYYENRLTLEQALRRSVTEAN